MLKWQRNHPNYQYATRHYQRMYTYWHYRNLVRRHWRLLLSVANTGLLVYLLLTRRL